MKFEMKEFLKEFKDIENWNDGHFGCLFLIIMSVGIIIFSVLTAMAINELASSFF